MVWAINEGRGAAEAVQNYFREIEYVRDSDEVNGDEKYIGVQCESV